jgi:hypothetical protein
MDFENTIADIKTEFLYNECMVNSTQLKLWFHVILFLNAMPVLNRIWRVSLNVPLPVQVRYSASRAQFSNTFMWSAWCDILEILVNKTHNGLP